MTRVVAAAIKQGAMICSVPRPGRHHDVIREMAKAGIPIPINGEQGFLTSDGLFVNRRLGLDIALVEEQLIQKTGGVGSELLFSEDVW